MRKQNSILKILAGLVGGILGYALVSSMYEAGRNKSRVAAYDSHISQEADSMNKKLPMMFDAETRLDKVAAGSGQIIYFFSLPNLAKTNLDLSVLQKSLQENATANYKTNSKLGVDRANNTAMKYQYKDKNGELLFEFSVSPKDF